MSLDVLSGAVWGGWLSEGEVLPTVGAGIGSIADSKDPESSRIPEMADSGQSAGVGSDEARIPGFDVSGLDELRSSIMTGNKTKGACASESGVIYSR